MDGMGTDVGIHVAGHVFPWISCLPTLNCLEGFFSARATHYRERLQAKRWGNPVFGSIYIYIETYVFFVLIWPFTFWNVSGQKVLVEQHTKQEAWVKTTHQEKTNSASLVKNDGEATRVIMLWVMVSHEATFFGSNLQTVEPLLVLHVVAVQKAFVAGVAGYGCKELWHVMGKDCEGLRR